MWLIKHQHLRWLRPVSTLKRNVLIRSIDTMTLNHLTAMFWYSIKHQLLLKKIQSFLWHKKLHWQQESPAKTPNILALQYRSDVTCMLAAHTQCTYAHTRVYLNANTQSYTYTHICVYSCAYELIFMHILFSFVIQYHKFPLCCIVLKNKELLDLKNGLSQQQKI